MDIVILGSGGPRPHKARAAPSHAVVEDGSVILIDCGPGAGHNAAKAGLSFGSVSHVLLTHTHLDHCLELPVVYLAGYLEGRKGPVTFYGPPGTTDVVAALLAKAFPYVDELVSTVMNVTPQFRVVEVTQASHVEVGPFSVSAAEVDHNFPCVGYRVEATTGRSATFSGDTAPTERLVALAKNTDLLVHDCAFPDDMQSIARATYHTAPAELGEIGARAHPKRVMLTHLFPACDGREQEMAESVRQSFEGEVLVAEDFLSITV